MNAKISVKINFKIEGFFLIVETNEQISGKI